MEIQVKRKQGVFLVDADFSCPDTGITALSGPSGSGKSSIINMVAGLAKPDQGRIALNGRVLFDSAQRINLPPEKRQVGYVFQDGRLFRHFSVKSNLLYGFKRAAPTRRFIDFNHIVELLGIGHLLNRRPASLSGGEKQRVAIGRALLACPSLLLLDEPLASLDMNHKQEIMPYIKKLNREFKVPMLYVSHDAGEIKTLADMVVCIRAGRIVQPA